MDSPNQPAPRPRGRRSVLVVGGIVALVAIVLLLTLLTLRRPIAENLAHRWLAEHGVASGLQVHSLSLTGLSASLRLGSSSDPDLTIDRVDVGYAVSWPGLGRPFGLETRSLRLVRPRLRMRLVGGRPDLGALQPLLREAGARPTGAAAPDITVENGELVLLTPDGVLRVHGDGALRGGLLKQLDGQLEPFALAREGVRLQGDGGGFHVARDGDRVAASVDLGPVFAQRGPDDLRASRLSITAEGPYPPRQPRPSGRMRLALAAQELSMRAGPDLAPSGTLNVDLDGVLNATASRQDFTGRLLATAQLKANPRRGGIAESVATRIDLAQLTMAHDALGWGGDGGGAATFDGSAAGRGGRLAMAGAALVRDLRVQISGSGTRVGVTLIGGLRGRGSLSPDNARRLARRVPVLSGEAAYAAATERGLRGYRLAAPRWRADLSERGAKLTLGEPLRLDTDSGAHLVLTPSGHDFTVDPHGASGAAALSLDGGGLPTLQAQFSNASMSAAGFHADLAARGALDALFARGAQFQLQGRLAGAGPRVRFDLAGCGPVTARRLAFDPNAVADFGAKLCPGDGPLMEVGPAGWTSRGRLQQARGDAPSFAVDLREATGAFAASGAANRLGAVTLVLDRGQLADTTAPIRFRPVNASGRIDLGSGAWTGAFYAATRAGHPLGKVTIHDDVASGVGRADVDASVMAFSPGGLQPAELTPLANFAREADGAASFKGWFAWKPGAQGASGGELVARNLKFKSALGAVLGIDADLHFASLAPLVTAPDQKIAVALVQAITPLSGLSAQFDLDADSVTIDAASGRVAEGQIRLEPIVAPLAPGATVKGVLVFDHVNVGEILATTSLADSVKLDGVVDGRIPFELGPSGLTVRQGHLAAVAPGRLSISRKALTGGVNGVAAQASPGPAAPQQTGFAQDLAYQAMENLAFDQLDATVNSLPGDRLGMLFHIRGRHDPPRKQGASIALSDLMRGQALAKPMNLPSDTRIDLTLDTSLNFGELVRALGQAWRDSLEDGGGAGPRSAPVQGQASSLIEKGTGRP